MSGSDPLLPGLRLPAFTVSERMHGEVHLLLWQVRGSTELRLGAPARSVVVRAGELGAIPAGVTHRLRVAGDSIVLPVWLPLALGRIEPPGRIWDVDAELELLLLAHLQELSGGVLSSGAEVPRALADRLQARAPHPDALPPLPSSPGAARAAAAVLTGAETGAPALLSAGYSSRRTLERQFRAETGLAPVQWIRRVRLHQALGHLRRGASVQEAAARAGYADPGAFRRAFRARFGVPPSRHHEIGEEIGEDGAPTEDGGSAQNGGPAG